MKIAAHTRLGLYTKVIDTRVKNKIGKPAYYNKILEFDTKTNVALVYLNGKADVNVNPKFSLFERYPCENPELIGIELKTIYLPDAKAIIDWEGYFLSFFQLPHVRVGNVGRGSTYSVPSNAVTECSADSCREKGHTDTM